MGCPCNGARAGSAGCSCSGPSAKGYANYVSYDTGNGNGGYSSKTTYSRSGPSYGNGDTRTTRTTTNTYSGNGSLFNTAMAEKAEMQGLNNELAGFMQKLSELCKSGAGAVDPAKYHEMLRMLENEINKLRNMYDSELANLRRQLQDALQRAAQVENNFDANRGTIGDLQGKLQMETARARKAEDEINALTKALADKEKQIADLMACIGQLRTELERLRPDSNRLMRENEELRRQLECEKKLRADAEARMKALEGKLQFDNRASEAQQRDLNDRIRVANDIISSLEAKLKQLANDQGGNLPALLQRLRDGTVAEMRKFQQETDNALNNNLNSLKRQMDEDAAMRDRLQREKAALEDRLRQCCERVSQLEGELAGLKSMNGKLQQALENEKSQSAAALRDLENRLRGCQNEVMSKVKEYHTARDAQASLDAEIKQYRGILDVGQNVMVGCQKKAAWQESQMVNCDALNGGGSRPSMTSRTTTTTSYQSRPAMPDICPPSEPPPSYGTVTHGNPRKSNTYNGPTYPVARVTSSYNQPEGCPPGPSCDAYLPQINRQQPYTTYAPRSFPPSYATSVSYAAANKYTCR